MAAPAASVWPLPTEIADFDDDERISFSRLDNKYIAVQDDGTEYEFDAVRRRWIPTIDEDLMAAQQSAYFGRSSDAPYDDSKPSKKRKQQDEVSRASHRTQTISVCWSATSCSSSYAGRYFGG